MPRLMTDAEAQSLNADQPLDQLDALDNYSILSELETFRGEDGKFTLKLFQSYAINYLATVYSY